MLTVEFSNQQHALPVDDRRLRDAVEMVLEQTSIDEVTISLVVVDDLTIREIHRRYLDQDEPTDVISFVLERSANRLEGEVIVSAETACRSAPRFGWSAEEELLLYVLHGTLHLAGYRDSTNEEQIAMRSQERAYLSRFGLKHHESEIYPRQQTGVKEIS